MSLANGREMWHAVHWYTRALKLYLYLLSKLKVRCLIKMQVKPFKHLKFKQFGHTLYLKLVSCDSFLTILQKKNKIQKTNT